MKVERERKKRIVKILAKRRSQTKLNLKLMQSKNYSLISAVYLRVWNRKVEKTRVNTPTQLQAYFNPHVQTQFDIYFYSKQLR